MRWCRNVQPVISYKIRIGTFQNIIFIIIQPLVERRGVSYKKHINYSIRKWRLFKRSSVCVTCTLVVKLSQQSGRCFRGFRNRRAYLLHQFVCTLIRVAISSISAANVTTIMLENHLTQTHQYFLAFLERYYTNINEHNIITRVYIIWAFASFFCVRITRSYIGYTFFSY